MGIIIDGVIVLIILLSVFLGYKKGLVSLGIHLVAFIIALVVAFVLYRPIGSLIINTTEIDESLQGVIETKLEEIVDVEDENITVNSLIGNIESSTITETSRGLAMNIIYGATIIILFIILFFSLNILYNLEKDISLFKLLGFKNKKIILITLGLLYIYYFLMFLISILLARIIYFIFSLNSLKLILGVNNLYILNINNYILLWLIISIFIILSFIRVTYKVIKISPINLIKAE